MPGIVRELFWYFYIWFCGNWPLFLLAVFLYFLPWIIAAIRKHPQRGAIVALNVFAGWTFLGWLAALVWACSTPQCMMKEI